MKQYPVEQIDYALTRLLTYSEEHLLDTYGRSGHLINRGDVYAFQPTEITDEYASLLERMAPVEYKPTHLELELPKKIAPLESVAKKLEKTESDSSTSTEEEYEEIHQELAYHIQSISVNSKIDSGETDWYKSLANVYSKLTEYHHIPAENIRKYAIYHYLDVLPFSKRFLVLGWLYKDTLKMDDEIGVFSKQYFEEKRVDNGNENRKVVLLYISEQDIRLFQQNPDNLSSWTPLTEQESRHYRPGLEKIYKDPGKYIYSEIVGLMTPFKKGEMVFKMKDINQKRNNFGVHCRGAGREDVMERLNRILGEPIYNETFIKQRILKRVDGKIVKDKKGNDVYEDNGIFNNGLCVILEMLLRYYQETKKGERIWFFDIESTVINQIVKYKKT
jgi:hypothetical protein